VIAGIFLALIWLYLLLARGGFWRIRDTEIGAMILPVPRRIAVVIPARNEADVIGRAIASLLKQAYPGVVHIFLVDDHSEDGTAECAGASEMLTVIPAGPLPAGWTGKLWAIAEGVRQSTAFEPDFILLTDADIVHAPDNLARLIARAESGGYDLVSLMVRLHCETFAEKTLIPAFVFFFFKLYPPEWIANSRHATAGAAGGCMLIRRAAIERIGGIASIRGEVIDDCALARAVKSTGGSVWLGTTSATHSIRPYGSWAEIGRMISRSAFTQLGHSTVLLAGAIAGMLITYLLPVLSLVTGNRWAGVAWGLMTLAYIPAVRFYRLSWLWVLALPALAVFFMGATIHSAVQYWRGRGAIWKGRVQDRRV
jgi:hopene-associated glycosyltransferase HpnB